MSAAPEPAGTGPGAPIARIAIALAAALAALVLQGWDLAHVGITWDELSYFHSARQTLEWIVGLADPQFRAIAFEPETIAAAWRAGLTWNPHPPLHKLAMGATHLGTASWLGDVESFRLASRLWLGLLAATVAWIGATVWGTGAAITAVAATLLMPRLLGHSFIGATDMPLTALWLLASYAAWRHLEHRGIGAAVLAVLALAGAMATKFTGFAIVGPLGLWALASPRPARAVVRLGALAAAALVVHLAFLPYAWADPLGYLLGFFERSAGREMEIALPSYYLGEHYGFRTPWHHAIVLTAFTVPVVTLVLAMIGTAGAASRETGARRGFVRFSILQIVFLWVVMALPSSPNHDGVRLFLPLFPFIALLAASGHATAVAMVTRYRPALGRSAGLVLIAALVLVTYPQVLRISPTYLSYYSEPVGGVAGGQRWGMEATYWYDAVTPAFLTEVNRTLRAGDRLAVFPSTSYFRDLQRIGRLRPDVMIVDGVAPDGPAAGWYLLNARQSYFRDRQWKMHREDTPVVAVRREGVVLVGLYRLE